MRRLSSICADLFRGGECRLTDNPVEYTQPACMDHVADEDAEGPEIDYGKGVSKHGKTKRNT